MNAISPLAGARDAVAAHPDKPATAVLHDTTDLRLLVFRIAPGQSVAPHRNASTVMLTVLGGDGILTGEAEGKQVERAVVPGDVVTYEPSEQHSMRAGSTELLLLATITPRPGSR